MKSLLFFAFLPLFLVLSQSLAAAASTPTANFNAWIYPGETFTANNVLYSTLRGNDNYQFMLEREGERYLLKYGQCAENANGTRRYCFNASDLADCDSGTYACPKKVEDGEELPSDWCCPYDVTHVKFLAGKPVWGAKLTITEIVPLLTVTRSTSTTKLSVGEEATVTVLVTNNGQQALTGIRYTEPIPAGFVVSSHEFTIDRRVGTISTTFNLDPGAEKLLRFTLSSPTAVNATLTGNLTFSFAGAEKLLLPTPLKLTVVDQNIFTSTSALPSTASVGQSLEYVYTLKNVKDGTIRPVVRFSGLTIPENELPTGVSREGAFLVWSGELAKGGTKELRFPFTARRSGKMVVVANTTVDSAKSSLKKEMSVTATPIAARFTVSRPKAQGGEQYTLRLALDNLAGDATFRDIDVTVTSDGGAAPRTKQYDVLSPAQSLPPFEMLFTAPFNATKVTHTAVITYATVYGEPFSLTKTVAIEVQPMPQSFLITQIANATSLVPGAELEMTVKVKNQGTVYRMVAVKDAVPDGAVVTLGTPSRELSLTAGEEVTAYQYRVRVPADYQDEIFPVTTSVDELTGTLAANQTKELAVKLPPKQSLGESNAANATEEKSAAVANGTTASADAVEKPGFFQRVLNWFKGLF